MSPSLGNFVWVAVPPTPYHLKKFDNVRPMIQYHLLMSCVFLMYVTGYSPVSEAVTAQRDSVEIMAIWLELIAETMLAGKPLGKWGFPVAPFDARVGSPILTLPQHGSGVFSLT